MNAQIPLTVIGGYLGAGKTTLINRILTGGHGRRIAVLVNDFGALNIDADLIASHDGETYALTNGCICCSIGDDLSTTLLTIASSDNPPDEVVIEASGVAEGSRFEAYSGDWHGLSLRAVVVMVDAETIVARSTDKYVGDLVIRQLEAADLLVLNKADLVDEQVLAERHRWLVAVGAAAPVVASTHGDVPADLIFSQLRPDETAPVSLSESSTDHSTMFVSTVVADAEPWAEPDLEAALAALPKSVVRAKGHARIAAGPDRGVLVQLVGKRAQITPADGPPTETRIVLIAVGDDAELEVAAQEFARIGRGDTAKR